MTIVTEYDWETNTWTHSGDHAARQAWRAAVVDIADKAKAKLPECSGRVDSAVKLVLAGDVELLPDGTAHVASQSNGTSQYVVCNGTCTCRDFAKAPHNLCKHRLSAAIARRAQALVNAKVADANGQAEAPAQPTPSAAAETSALLEPVETPHSAPVNLPEAPVSLVRRIGDGEECYQCNQECWDFLYTPTLSRPAMA